MSKNDNPAIEVGKPIKIEANSRPDADAQVAALIKQSEAQGLKHEGGFIDYKRTAEGEDQFWAVIKFNKP